MGFATGIVPGQSPSIALSAGSPRDFDQGLEPL